MQTYNGTIVEESLKDSRFVNQLRVLSVHISNEERPEGRWHLYKVVMDRVQIRELANQLLPGWYAHFWDATTIYAVFKGKEFEMSRADKTTWQAAIDFGLSVDIPLEQLDFLIDD